MTPTRSPGCRIATVLALVALLAVALVALSGGALAHTGDDSHHHDGPAGAHGGWMGAGWAGLLWPFAWLLVLLVVVGGAYLFVRGGPGETAGNDALAVLRERYARGEIDDEEFERRRAQLERD